jgi:glycosyltransferase involved in cell wall biosynthesis
MPPWEPASWRLSERMKGDSVTTSEQPLVTIGVPVYNGGSMLAESLQSLQNQTFTAFKVIICDNASTDGTPEICRRFTAADPRFEYHRNPTNIGAAPNFNRVFELGQSTPYFKWAAHDDIHAPTYLERCIDLLKNDPRAVLAYSMSILLDETREGDAPDTMCVREHVLESFIDEAGRPAWKMGPLHQVEGDDPASRLSDYLNRMTTSAEFFGVIRTDALRQTKLHASYYGSDRALFAHLALLGPFRQVAEPLFIFRFHQRASRSMSRQDLKAFIDPHRQIRWRLLQMYGDILQAPKKAALGPVDRLRCTGVTLGNFVSRYTGRAMLKVKRLGARNRPAALLVADERDRTIDRAGV